MPAAEAGPGWYPAFALLLADAAGWWTSFLDLAGDDGTLPMTKLWFDGEAAAEAAADREFAGPLA